MFKEKAKWNAKKGNEVRLFKLTKAYFEHMANLSSEWKGFTGDRQDDFQVGFFFY